MNPSYKRTCDRLDKIYFKKNTNIIIVTHGIILSNIVAWGLKLTLDPLKEVDEDLK